MRITSLSEIDGLTEKQREEILTWYAWKIWMIDEEGSGCPDYYCKSYDPLEIEGRIAHSYVFDLRDGGRHHSFKDLDDLETMLDEEAISNMRNRNRFD